MNEKEEKSVLPPEEPDFEDPNFNWEEWDKLGFKGVAENIVTDIEAFGTPLIYGVYGRWGSGKTTMMRAIQDCFKARKGYKTVWFDPWWYDHADKEQLFLGLLRKIEKEIAPKDNTTLTEIGVKFTAGAIAALRLVVDAGTSLLGIGKVTEDAKKFYKDTLKLIEGEQKKQVDAVEETQNNLCNAIDDLLKKGEILVLVVDDLDRCLPDRAILLLDQLKNFLYLSRVVTVLGIDDEVFANMLNKHYHYEEENFGSQYLDKIIRHSYRLGSGTIEKLLEMYVPHTELLQKCPLVVPAFVKIWPLIGDVNPRIVRRLAEKLIRIDEVDDAEGKCTMVSNRASQDNNVRSSWSIFRERASKSFVRKADDKTQVSSGTFGFQEALLVSLCCTIAFSFLYPFPLDLENLDSRLDTFKRNGMTPPLEVLNLMYEEFKEWL